MAFRFACLQAQFSFAQTKVHLQTKFDPLFEDEMTIFASSTFLRHALAQEDYRLFNSIGSSDLVRITKV